MAGKLTFSPDQANSVASNIKKKAQNATDLVNQLHKEIKSVSSWWQGESQVAFVEQFESLLPSFNKMISCVNTISDNLKEIARVKLEAESEIARKLRG